MLNKLIISMLVIICAGCAQTKIVSSEKDSVLSTELVSEDFKYTNQSQVNTPSIEKESKTTISQAVPPSDTYVAPPFLSTAPTQFVTAVAIGDSVTTYVALSGNAVEKNPLVNTSPAGLLAVLAVKMGVTYYFDKQPEPVRAQGLKTMAGIWGGVNVNNLLVIAGASNPVSLIGGIIAGVGAYYYQEKLLAEEKQKMQENLQNK
jgi:hypothetical protein